MSRTRGSGPASRWHVGLIATWVEKKTYPQSRQPRGRRVLFTHASAELYGSDRMALETVRLIRDAGWDVEVVLPVSGPLVGQLRDVGAVVTVEPLLVLRKSDLSLLRLPLLFLQSALSVARALRLVAHRRPNLVYVNTMVQPWWVLAASILRRPVIEHVREAEDEAPKVVKALLNAPLLLCDHVVCNSKATQEVVSDALKPLTPGTSVVYNGKDWGRYSPTAARGPRCNPLKILVIGRLSPRKGQDLVVGAAKLLDQPVEITFAGDTFAGYEWFERELAEQISDAGLNDACEFLGFVEDVASHLAKADVLVVPSRIEPFGTVAAEGLAAGVLTIVSNVQGLIEIVEDGASGLIFERESADGLAAKLQWVIDNPAKAALIAERGPGFVQERFSSNAYAAAILDLVAEYAEGD